MPYSIVVMLLNGALMFPAAKSVDQFAAMTAPLGVLATTGTEVEKQTDGFPGTHERVMLLVLYARNMNVD